MFHSSSFCSFEFFSLRSIVFGINGVLKSELFATNVSQIYEKKKKYEVFVDICIIIRIWVDCEATI